MQNPDDPTAQEILAVDATLSVRVQTLRDTYTNVVATVEAFPESMQPAVLHVLSPQVGGVLTSLSVHPDLITQINRELQGILGRYQTPSLEELQAVGQQLSQDGDG